MSIKVSALQKQLEETFMVAQHNYNLFKDEQKKFAVEKLRFRHLFTIWGREYGWRKVNH
jgi:hypothetical protein